MGMAQPGFIMQDREGETEAGGGIRLRMEDWIRFAQWIKRSAKAPGCFGDYVRVATSTQIDNPGTPATRKMGKLFGGYGYLTWTRNTIAPDTRGPPAGVVNASVGTRIPTEWSSYSRISKAGCPTCTNLPGTGIG